MTTTEKVAALLRRLRIEMNGAVAGGMSDYGGPGREYGLNYGVSLPTIREVAQAYAPDQELAEALWRQDVRELKLAALFVAAPAEMTAVRMAEWGSGWRGTEMAGHCAMQLFWQSPDALVIVRQWLATGAREPYTFHAALFMLGKLAGDPGLGDGDLRRMIEGLPASGGKALEYALREIYRRRAGLREDVLQLLDRMPSAVADEVRWQLEYLG